MILTNLLTCLFAYLLISLLSGASDGIGKAMASQLAKKGLNIILISRTKSKLDEVKKEIEEKYKNISVKVILTDICNACTHSFTN